jgi:hypothetical protein
MIINICPIEILVLERVCLQWSCEYFFGKGHLIKISTLEKVQNLLQSNYFSGVDETSLHFTKSGGDQLKYFSPFFKPGVDFSYIFSRGKFWGKFRGKCFPKIVGKKWKFPRKKF